MKNKVPFAALLFALTGPLTAQDWSIGIGTGPFVFGDFIERRMRIISSVVPQEPIVMTLSAATRAGLAVDIERSFAERWALRVEGTFTSAPLSIKQGDDTGFELDAGEIDVTTLTAPLVFRINPNGAFRFHLFGGPAYAMYKTSVPANSGDISVSDRTNNEWGITFGGGVAWWLHDRMAIEGRLTDTITTSPFSDFDDDATPGTTVKKPHNVHTTIGVRWRF